MKKSVGNNKKYLCHVILVILDNKNNSGKMIKNRIFSRIFIICHFYFFVK